MQRQAGSGTDVDQRDPAVWGARRQGGEEIGAPADLVHLVAVDGAQLQQPVALIEAERAVLLLEVWAQRGLRLAEAREPVTQRLRLELEHQRGGGGGKQ